MPSNEVTEQVSPSRDLLEKVVDSNVRSDDTIAELQAGFSGMIETNQRLAEALEALTPAIEAFRDGGGAVDENGMSGGAISFTQLSDESVESLTSGFRDVIEQVVAEQRKQTDELNKTTREEGEKTRQTQRETSEKLGESIGQSFSEQLSGGLGDVASAAGTVGDLAGAIGSGNLTRITSVLRGAIGAAAPVAAGIGALAAVGGAMGQVSDLVQSARSVSIEQTGGGGDLLLGASMQAQAMTTGYTTGLSQQQVEQIQKGLVAGRAMYGTEEYDTGFQFALNANQNYNLDVATATQWYTDAVVKGGMSVNDLNEALEGLAEKAEETGMSMTEVTQQFQRAATTWGSAVGSTAIGLGYASEMQGYFTGGSQLNMASTMVGGIDWTNNATANTIRMQYVDQGYSDAQAMTMAARDMAEMGVGASGPQLLLSRMELTDGGGKTFWDYVDEGDREGLLAALGNLSDAWEMRGGNIAIRQALAAYGVDTSEISNDEDLVDYIMGYGEGLENMEGGETVDRYGDEWSSIKDDASGVKSSLTGSSLTGSGGDWMDFTLAAGGYLDLDRAIDWGSLGSDNMDERGRNRVLSVLSQEGLISDEVGMGLNDQTAGELASGLLGMYEQSGDSRTFTEWLTSKEASGEVGDYLSQYDRYAVESASKQSDVNVTIGWADGADQVLRAKVESANNEAGRNDGTES